MSPGALGVNLEAWTLQLGIPFVISICYFVTAANVFGYVRFSVNNWKWKGDGDADGINPNYMVKDLDAIKNQSILEIERIFCCMVTDDPQLECTTNCSEEHGYICEGSRGE